MIKTVHWQEVMLSECPPGLGVNAIDGAPKPEVISKLDHDLRLACRLLNPERVHPSPACHAPAGAKAISYGRTSISPALACSSELSQPHFQATCEQPTDRTRQDLQKHLFLHQERSHISRMFREPSLFRGKRRIARG